VSAGQVVHGLNVLVKAKRLALLGGHQKSKGVDSAGTSGGL